MDLRGAIKSIFGGDKKITASRKEIGGYPLGLIFWRERACIRTLSEHTSKANVKVLRDGMPGDSRHKLIQYPTEPLYERQGLLIQNRTLLEINNVAFIYMRDELGRFTDYTRCRKRSSEAVELEGRL